MPEKDWKFVEQLAALCERALAPGAVVRSPDYLPDRDTKELREVDVSIRYQVGSVNVLITIECRDRGRVEDSCWIEQLAQKKLAIGARATIAVSTSGFSKPAQDKAAKLDIELRQVSSIKDAHVEQWFLGLEVTITYLIHEVALLGLVWPNGTFPPGLPKSLTIRVPDNVWLSPIFRTGAERQETSLENLIRGRWDLFQGHDIPVGQEATRKILICPEPQEEIYFRRFRQDFLLAGIELTAVVKSMRQTMNVEDLRQYANKDNVLVYAGRGQATAGLESPLDFVVLKHSRGLTVSVSQQPWWKRKRPKPKKGRQQ